MNIDLNTAASQSYELAQQLVNHYISYGAQSEPVMAYAKEFYEYLTSDIPYDFDTLSQSLKTIVGRHCAQMSAQYCRHNDKNNNKILKAAKEMESAMRSSRNFYSSSRMSISLPSFSVKSVSPQEIVNQSFNELDQYAAFVKMATSNDWSGNPDNFTKLLDELVKKMDEDLSTLSADQHDKIKAQIKKYELEMEREKIRSNSSATPYQKLANQLKPNLSTYNEAYWDLHDEPDDLHGDLHSPSQRKRKL